MAKFEQNFSGNFYEFIAKLERDIVAGSASANLEDKSDFIHDNYKCAVRVFERYSMMGGNRVSLSVTLVGVGDNLFISAISSGGSQAVLFKLNTFGEQAFLDCVIECVNEYLNK